MNHEVSYSFVIKSNSVTRKQQYYISSIHQYIKITNGFQHQITIYYLEVHHIY